MPPAGSGAASAACVLARRTSAAPPNSARPRFRGVGAHLARGSIRERRANLFASAPGRARSRRGALAALGGLRIHNPSLTTSRPLRPQGGSRRYLAGKRRTSGRGRTLSPWRRANAHRVPHVPSVRGDVRARAAPRRRRDRARPRRPRRRVQPRLPLPEGHRRSSSSRRIPTASAGRCVRRGDTFHEVTWDEAFEAIDAGLTPIREQHGHRRARGVPRQPERAQPRRVSSTTACSCRRRAPKNVFSASTVDQMPKQVSAGLHVRRRARRSRSPTSTAPTTCSCSARTRTRRTASLMTAPDMPGRLAGARERAAASSSSSTRAARKTAEDADEHLPIRPGDRRTLPLRARARAVRRRPRRPRRRSPTTSTVVDEVARARRAASRPRRSRRRAASTPRRSAASRTSSRPRRPPRCTAASARARRSSARSRRGSSTCSTCCTGNLDRPGGAMFTKRRDRRRAGGATGQGPRRPLRSPHVARCAGCPSSSASSRSCASPRRSRRRATARSARWSRSPATRRVDARTPTGSTRALADARLHGQRRHLPQRDDAPRRT